MPIEVVTGADAQANVCGQPINLMLYGPPGTEKTSDAVKLFVESGHARAFVIYCEDGALKSVAARGWPVPDHVKRTVKTWAEMQEAISWLGAHRQNYTGVVIDGFSTFCTYIYKEAEEAYRGEKNKYAIPTAVRGSLLALREWLRMLGLHVVVTAHPQPPIVQEGVFYPGGFAMSPKTLIEGFFGLMDTVIRVGNVQPAVGAPPARAYFTGGTVWPTGVPEPHDWRLWRTKNREGCNAAIVEADLGKFLRARQPPYGGL